MTDIFKTIIVPLASVDDARLIAAQYPDGGHMFIAELTSDLSGNPPATHYASSGYMDDGIPPALAEVAGIDISDEQWPDACARLLLRRVAEEV